MLFNRISLFRRERGLSRKELADLVSVNPQTIGYLERGDYRPTVELALKLAQAFGVSPQNERKALAGLRGLSGALPPER